ncbi:hypothetical protein N7495_002600, partial [Penicillium taxi]|uniref:uncharacterized protein n=1 Tax=Penicillium taxi TaxID=168475 RepID=UPI0025456FEB
LLSLTPTIKLRHRLTEEHFSIPLRDSVHASDTGFPTELSNLRFPEPIGANWSEYGFGTLAFANFFKAALVAHKEAMDFALGPNQGQGVPAKSDDEGLQWDLVFPTPMLPYIIKSLPLTLIFRHCTLQMT